MKRPGALEPRRENRTRPFAWRSPVGVGEHEFEVTVGFDQNRRGKEIFATGPKEGSVMRFLVEDFCVTASLLLQSGYSLVELSRSLGRDDGEQYSPLGALVRFACEIEAGYQREPAAAGLGTVDRE